MLKYSPMIFKIRYLYLLPFLLIGLTFAAYSSNGTGGKWHKIQQAGTSIPANDEILRIMTQVAGWQLHNPVRFDIIFNNPEEQQTERIRVLWNGDLVFRQKRNFNPEKSALPVGWLKYADLIHEDISFCELPEAVQSTLKSDLSLNPENILQIKMEDHSSVGWEQGALFAGLFALYEVSGDPIYLDALTRIGKANKWKLGPRIFHADDHCVGQVYLDLYRQLQQSDLMEDVQMRFDWIMKNPAQQAVIFKEGQSRWTWCDALFMSPPVWTKLYSLTGNRDYLDFMDNEWWSTTEHLYDKEENLFFRDANYFNRKEKNGKKIFWSRGNGWVIAGIARLLNDIPMDYSSRQKYEQLFREMAMKIAMVQPENGLWRPSLLDPDSYSNPETSSSGFFCYAFAWGVNNGLLDREIFLPIIMKTWDGLVSCIHDDGMLGFVQLPGASPTEVNAAQTSSYGVGAFLLAGSELVKLNQMKE